MQLEVTQRNRS